MLGMISLLDHSKFISQKDMLEQIGKMHDMYNNNFNWLLVLFTAAVAVIGFIIPWILKLYQKNQLKDDIIELVIADFDKKIEIKTKELEDNVNEQIELMRNENKYSLRIVQSALSENDKQYEEAIKLLLEAANSIIDKEDSDYYLPLYNNLVYIENKLKESRKNNHWFLIDNSFELYINKLKDRNLNEKFSNEIVDEIIKIVKQIYNDNNSFAYLNRNNGSNDESPNEGEGDK